MRLDELRDQYMETLIERTTAVRYPSKELLDRVEQLAYRPEQAEKLVNYLIDNVEASRYPSHEMLDRIERILFGTSARRS